MTITRRRALLDLASLTSAGAAGACAAAALSNLPPETTASHNALYSTRERLQHHLLMAAQAADELVKQQNARWSVHMAGRVGDQPVFSLDAYVAEVGDDPRFPYPIERYTKVSQFVDGRWVL